jgi:hypothetical protein
VAFKQSNPPRPSPVFEQLNVNRLKRCSQSVSRAERLIADAKRAIARSREIVEDIELERHLTQDRRKK